MNKKDDLRQELEQFSPAQLEEMLREETTKEKPDDDLVLLLLRILEERKGKTTAALDERGEAAWEAYQAKRKKASRRIHFGWGMRAASLAVVICLLFALIPQQATAGSFWKVLTSWTDDFFEYINSGASNTEPAVYEFHSENPGLQEVYDAVTEELEITKPVVAQWLPEGYELEEIIPIDTPTEEGIYARFVNGDDEAVLSFRKMETDFSPQYDKSKEPIEKIEINGVAHYYMWNNDNWTISWARQNLKCAISVDCTEGELEKIIDSIYE